MRRFVLVFAALSLVVGCSSAKRKVVPVAGKLTWANGKPLPTGTKLLFNPSEGRVGTAFGVTDAEGNFTLKHVTGRDGAEIGKYMVQLRAPDGDDGSFFKTLPRDYYDSGVLVAEIAEGMSPLSLKVQTQLAAAPTRASARGDD